MFGFFDRLERFTGRLAKALAFGGGLVLFAIIGVTILSIAGRSLSELGWTEAGQLALVSGSYELVELSMGFAIFTFLPLTHWHRAHASVDLLRPVFGKVGNWLLTLLADGLMLALAVLITWRLWLGMLDKASYFETSFILQIPLSWGYGAAFVAACVYCWICVAALLRTALKGRNKPDLPHEEAGV